MLSEAPTTPPARLENIFDAESSPEPSPIYEPTSAPPTSSQPPPFLRPMGVNWPRKAIHSPEVDSSESEAPDVNVSKTDGVGAEELKSDGSYETSEEEEEQVEESDYAPSNDGPEVRARGSRAGPHQGEERPAIIAKPKTVSLPFSTKLIWPASTNNGCEGGQPRRHGGPIQPDRKASRLTCTADAQRESQSATDAVSGMLGRDEEKRVSAGGRPNSADD